MASERAEERGTLLHVQHVIATKGVERALKLARRGEFLEVGDRLLSSMEGEGESAFLAALDVMCKAEGVPVQEAPKKFTFSYVKIPADPDAPFEELTTTTNLFGDTLPELLQRRFAGGSVVHVEQLRAEYGSAVDEKMAALNLAAARGSVETFALVRPSETTRPIAHSGTYLYLDEMGVLKGLPVNKRASEIASSCGLDVESPFLGDVFIGRVVVKPAPMRNASFSLAELDSGSEWLRSAPVENEHYQQARAHPRLSSHPRPRPRGRIPRLREGGQDD